MEAENTGFCFKGSDSTSEAERKLLLAVEQKLRDRPDLEYYQALKLVASERPDLNMAYTREVRGSARG